MLQLASEDRVLKTFMLTSDVSCFSYSSCGKIQVNRILFPSSVNKVNRSKYTKSCSIQPNKAARGIIIDLRFSFRDL